MSTGLLHRPGPLASLLAGQRSNQTCGLPGTARWPGPAQCLVCLSLLRLHDSPGKDSFCIITICCYQRGAGGWEHSPVTDVARVRARSQAQVVGLCRALWPAAMIGTARDLVGSSLVSADRDSVWKAQELGWRRQGLGCQWRGGLGGAQAEQPPWASSLPAAQKAVRGLERDGMAGGRTCRVQAQDTQLPPRWPSIEGGAPRWRGSLCWTTAGRATAG